jgi:transcriptional regulator with XRE-family HTH domain
MKERDLPVALTVLRIIRGWSQEELARHSGVRPSSISDYERGKIMPGAGTLLRLLDAMGYTFSALDGTQTLIASVRGNASAGAASLRGPAPAGRATTSRHWEVEQAAVEAGKVVTRLSRLYFALLDSKLPGAKTARVGPAAEGHAESEAKSAP